MIIFLYGADTFRSRRKLQELKTKFIKDVDTSSQSLSVLDGQTANLKEIAEKIGTGSLFVKKRMVVVENIFKNKKEKIFGELMEYLKRFTKQKNEKDNILIFWDEELGGKPKALKVEAKKLFTFLGKQDYVQEFTLLDSVKLLNFVKKEAESYNRSLSGPAATLLINLTGGDLWMLSREIKKLAFHAVGQAITPEEVKEMTASSFSENIFALTDALSAKNKNLAVKLLEEQYAAGLSDEYLLAMLIRQFKILWQLRAALDDKFNPAEMPVKLKLHPFVVKKGLLAARNFTAAGLKSYLNRLIRLDALNKTGATNIRTELTLLIAGL